MKTLARVTDLASIHNRIALISPADTALWGSMNAHQMVCHLTDTFGCPLGQRVPRPIKASSIPTPIYKRLALWVPAKWPHGAGTAPEMDQAIGGTPPTSFAADRASLVAILSRFAGSCGPWGPHPIFGAMNAKEWMRWGYLHTDHHLRQFGR